MKRTRLRRVGKRKKAELGELRTFRIEVFEWAGYRCERCGSDRNLHPHHIFPKGRGGSNDRSNGLAICWDEHRLVHDDLIQDAALWIARNAKEAAIIRARLDDVLGS